MMKQLICRMIEEFDGERKRVEHTIKVYGFSRVIGLSEGLSGSQLEILEAAALLHDIGIPAAVREYGSSAGPYQEKTGALIAYNIMSELKPAIAKEVNMLVGHHHSFGYDGGIILQILFEADFLVNLSEGSADAAKITAVKKNIFRTELGLTLLDGIFKKELEA